MKRGRPKHTPAWRKYTEMVLVARAYAERRIDNWQHDILAD